MSEVSEIDSYSSGDRDTHIEHAKKMIAQVAELKPDEIGCMLVCAVTFAGEVKVGLIGSDASIAKMLVTVSTVAREGVIKASAESNPTNETAH